LTSDPSNYKSRNLDAGVADTPHFCGKKGTDSVLVHLLWYREGKLERKEVYLESKVEGTYLTMVFLVANSQGSAGHHLQEIKNSYEK
jgi:hypothetical protein